MPRQSRKASAAEAITNIAVGYGVNLSANFLIFPLFDWDISIAQNLAIGALYTIISFLRSYLLRRLYNLF